MTKEERLKLRSMLLYLADCMILANDVEGMNSCQNCKIRPHCGYCPKPGESLRFNCPLWQPDRKRGIET